MRVDQRDDQAERLREIVAPEPALDLARVDLVPAQPERAGVTGPEVLGLRVLPGVRRLPVCEAELVVQPVGVGPSPAAEQRALAVGGMGEVPLALVGDLVATHAQDIGEALGAGLELRLVPRLRSRLHEAPPEVAQGSPARGVRAGQHPKQLAQHRRGVAEIGSEVGLGVRQGDAMLRRVAAREQRRPARRAHRGVGERPMEGEGVLLEGVLVRGQVAEPARVLGPVARIALLVRDQQQDVGRGHPGRGSPAPAAAFIADIRVPAISSIS